MSLGRLDVCGAGCLGDDPNSAEYSDSQIVFVLESNRWHI